MLKFVHAINIFHDVASVYVMNLGSAHQMMEGFFPRQA